MSVSALDGVIAIAGSKKFIDKLQANMEEIIDGHSKTESPDPNSSDFKQQLKLALEMLEGDNEVAASDVTRLSDHALRFYSTVGDIRGFINMMRTIDKTARVYFKLLYESSNLYNFYDPTGDYFCKFELGDDFKTNDYDELMEHINSNGWESMDDLSDAGYYEVAGRPVHKDFERLAGRGGQPARQNQIRPRLQPDSQTEGCDTSAVKSYFQKCIKI